MRSLPQVFRFLIKPDQYRGLEVQVLPCHPSPVQQLKLD
jgi:hypothetical protein